jgi:hypothetical protein
MGQPGQPHEYSEEEIINRIYIVRNQKVMLDRDLAEMYGVPTYRLNEAVKRNIARFPEDFMFQLSGEEQKVLRSQIAILETGKGKHSKYLPYAFTEQGVAMLSSVLNSELAIQVNIRIIRVYTKIRQLLLESRDLWKKIEEIEQGMLKKDEEIKAIFNILKKFLIPESKPKAVIGFKIPGANKDS